MKPRETRNNACTLCKHPDRARIELLRVGGASIDALAEKFSIHRDAIWRHCRNHVTPERKSELLAGPVKLSELSNRVADESMSLLDELKIVKGVLFQAFLTRGEAGDSYGVSVTASRLLEAMRDHGKLTGELKTIASGLTINQNTLNVFGDPSFLRLQEGLLLLTRKHPQIRDDVVDLLNNMEPATTPAMPNGSKYSSAPMIECEAISGVA
jgi:hypothetical protein